MRPSRRSFLAGTLLAPLVPWPGSIRSEEPARPSPILDIHVHLFGTGDGGSGCMLSKTVTDGVLFRSLITTLGVRRRGATIDAGYRAMLSGQVKECGLDRVVVLAHDAVYDSKGRRDDKRTHVYVPNDYLLAFVKEHSKRVIPCISINPDRADAVDELERCHTLGARVLKIHPPIQGVDISDKKHTPFFRRCAKLNMLVMVHTGHEHAAPIIDLNLADPKRLQLALEQGCEVVACHSGTGWDDKKPDFLPGFLDLLEKFDRLRGDTAVLATGHRGRDIARLLEREAVLPRLLHGSDFPFPCVPLAFTKQLGLKKVGEIQLEKNLLTRDFLLKEAIGFGRASAERAYDLVTSRLPR